MPLRGECPTMTLEVLTIQLRNQREYFDAKLEASQHALTVALAANDKRLNSMNEFRSALNDTTNKMMTRVEALATIQSVDARAVAEVATLREKIEAFGKPNYVLFGSLASVFFVLVTGIWVVIGLKIDTSTAPLALAVSTLQTRQMQDEQRSITAETDRTRMNLAISESASDLVQSKADRAQLNTRARELEMSQQNTMLNRSSALTAITAEFARINTWMTFAQQKLYPSEPLAPPIQIPAR